MQKCFRISSDFNAVSNKNLPKSHLSLLCEQVLKYLFEMCYDMYKRIHQKVYLLYQGQEDNTFSYVSQ